MSTKVHLFRLPNTPYGAIEKFRALRLTALKTNPESFGSTLEREVAYTDAIWERQLSNPFAKIFVAFQSENWQPVTNKDSATLAYVLAAPWVGMMKLIGPVFLDEPLPAVTESPWTLVNKRKPGMDTDDPTETINMKTRVYIFNGLYISPAIRGQGVAKRLITDGIEAAREGFQSWPRPDTIVTVAFAMKSNEAAIKLYKRVGFVEFGQEYAVLDGKSDLLIALKRIIT